LRKIDTALALMDTHVDTVDLLAQLAIPIPTVVTPQMFTYQLVDWARSDRKHIVLPEETTTASSPRPDGFYNAGGRPDDPRRGSRGPCSCSRTGVDCPAAAVLDPQTSELCDKFADQYAELRKQGVSASSRPAKSSTTCRTLAPCWCTTTWWTAWCRVRGTPPRTPFGRRSR